ncbi:uncharacterized protein LOC120170596 isoform X2 [Hibiscus syriacus]|uniref:uncharacterized protein LOC120170596 isoform X2 n=1 Tax=Hibiscus syriacus TaxID=106335 RepID=UPI001924630C|nr:uncharacterized protein LOC120170596 isoform X2 [Hibiscus syriacus]
MFLPPQYITVDNQLTVNPAVEAFEEQDVALASWLLSTNFAQMVPQISSYPALAYQSGVSATLSGIFHMIPQFTPTASVSSQANSQAHIATPEIVDDNAWYPDSGATHHLTNDLANLQVDTTAPASGSVQDNYVSLEFYPRFCQAMELKIEQVVLRGLESTGLYGLEGLDNASVGNKAANRTFSHMSYFFAIHNDYLDLWHKRLGHPSYEVLVKALKDCSIDFPRNKINQLCRVILRKITLT